MARLRIGTAGWSIPAASAPALPAEGSQLERYAAVLDCVEINSSFHRPHRPQTYARWAAGTPAGFRFAVKCPRQITHERRLQDAYPLLKRFVEEAGALGDKWAVLLVQLPPSLALHAGSAARFFEQAHALFGGAIVCEPRHASWFTPEAEGLLAGWEVARVAADPARFPGAELPAGWPGIRYCRWHGSPSLYRSPYEADWLAARAAELSQGTGEAWCIFDNTASGAALGDALQLRALG